MTTSKKQHRGFKGVWIPRDVWLSPELSLQEKVFLVEIDSLNNEEKGCFATNDYFAEFFGISKCRAKQVICELVKKGLVKCEIDQAAGNRRRLWTLWQKTTRPSGKKLPDPPRVGNYPTLGQETTQPSGRKLSDLGQEANRGPYKDDNNNNTKDDRKNDNKDVVNQSPQLVLELDRQIVAQRDLLTKELQRLFHPGPWSARTLAKVVLYFVNSAQQDPQKICWFKDAIEWARIAAASSLSNKAGLFVKKVKVETGFSKEKYLLSDPSRDGAAVVAELAKTMVRAS